MFPTRLYGALARVFATAALLFAILVLAFSAHAEGRHHAGRPSHHHHHRARHERRIFARDGVQSVLPWAGPAAEITVFGRIISSGSASAEEDEAQAGGGFDFSLSSPFGGVGLSLDVGPKLSRSRVAEIVRARAEALGVPVRLALAITRYESGGRCLLRGRAGERGAMQVLPQTARSVGVTGNLYDCATGIEAGLRYLRLAVSMHAQAGWCAVASAYNSGTWRSSRCTHYGRIITYAAGMP